jgi:hypothetical protein
MKVMGDKEVEGNKSSNSGHRTWQSRKCSFWGWSSMLSTRACRMLVLGVGFVSCLEVRDNRMNFTSSIVDL